MTFLEMWHAAFPPTMWILLIVCAAMCAVGFYKFLYFISIGYGFAIMGGGIALLLLFGPHIHLGELLLCLLFIVYGIRLSGFLLFREFKSASYKKTLKEVTVSNDSVSFFKKVFIWIAVSLLYVGQLSAAYYRLNNGTAAGIMPLIAFVIMLIALTIETVADIQKSAAKKANPTRFCNTGLYKLVRCPNYFGEILFWTGVFVSCFGGLRGAVQWVVVVIAYIAIVYIMFSGAKRLEIRQTKSYGKLSEFQAYKANTPLLIPFLPIYSLLDWNFIKA